MQRPFDSMGIAHWTPHNSGGHITGTASRPDCQTGPSQRAGLPLSFVPSAAIVDSLLCVRDGCACEHLRASGSAALPQGPSLRSGLCCPGPSSLNRPHPPHSRAHPDFTVLSAYTRCLRCAHSHMPKRPTTGSELSLMLFHSMSSSETTGNFSAAYYPVLHRKRWPSTPVNSFGIPVILTLRFW